MALVADDSCEALSTGEARWFFQSCAVESPRAVRVFLARARGDTPLPQRASDDDVERWISERIDSGEFVAVRTSDAFGDGDTNNPWRALRQLIQKIETLTPGGVFRTGGRQYKLVAGLDLLRLPSRDEYELASQSEASRILREISQKDDIALGLVPLLKEAREKLSRDWRPPLEPDGILLLRRKVQNRVIRPKDVPVMTPSQMVPAKEKSWIEIELLDEDGEPYMGDVELTLANGKKVRGASNAAGLVRIEGIEAGNCQITLPDMDASGWSAA